MLLNFSRVLTFCSRRTLVAKALSMTEQLRTSTTCLHSSSRFSFHDLQSHLRVEDHVTRASLRSILLLLPFRPPALDSEDSTCRNHSRPHSTFKRHAKVWHPGEGRLRYWERFWLSRAFPWWCNRYAVWDKDSKGESGCV